MHSLNILFVKNCHNELKFKTISFVLFYIELTLIKEHGYNLDVTPIIFVGGGASVMKKFGTQKGANIKYIEDIRANAKGYEQLAKVFLSAVKGKIR